MRLLHLARDLCTTNDEFLVFLQRSSSSRMLHQLFSGGLTSDEERRQDGSACLADLIEVATFDFVYEAVSAEEAQLAADARRATFHQIRTGLTGWEEPV